MTHSKSSSRDPGDQVNEGFDKYFQSIDGHANIDDEIQDMKSQYQSLCELNESLPPQIQIPKEEMQSVDCGLHQFYENLYKADVEEIQSTLGNDLKEVINKRKLLEKTHENILNDEDTYIWGFKSNLFVKPLPSLQLPETFLDLKERVLTNNERESDALPKQSDDDCNIAGTCFSIETSGVNESKVLQNDIKDDAAGSRKKMRAKRRNEIRAKLKDAPLDQDDPVDVKAIKEIQANIGDWPMKLSSLYRVPFKNQIDTKSKLTEMIRLEDSMHCMKVAFNKEIEVLNDKRKQLVETIERRNIRIVEISKLIGEPIGSLWSPKLRSEADSITRESEVKSDKMDDATITSCSPNIPDSPQVMKYFRGASPVNLSPAEKDERVELETLLRYEKSTKMKDIENEVDNFDESLYRLHKKRFQIGTKVKCGELMLTSMLEELKIVSAFEKEGNSLLLKYTLCEQTLSEIRASISSQKDILDSRKEQLEYWLQKEKILSLEFKSLVPDNHPSSDILHKIYMRKNQQFRESNYLSDDNDDDDSSWESDEDEEDACPGVSEDFLQILLKLREKRYELGDELKCFQREIVLVKRNYDKLCGKENQADRELEEMSQHIQVYQNKKQLKLNSVQSFVTLSAQQIYAPDSIKETLMSQLEFENDKSSLCVVFSKTELRNLYGRIGILQDEIKNHKEYMKYLNNEKKLLAAETKAFERSISSLQQQCMQIQMLKFGQLVDLEAFDKIKEEQTVLPNESGADVTELLDREKQHDGHVHMLERDITLLKVQLKDATTLNTDILNRIGGLHERQLSLAQMKASANTKIDEYEEDPEEKKRLMNISRTQLQEIQKLEAEMRNLKK